jgi:hypothetical protein
MARFLEDNTFGLILPQCGAASLPSFANEDVSIPEFIFVNVFLLDENFLQIG